MTRLTGEQGLMLRERLAVRPEVTRSSGGGDYSSLPPAVEDTANINNQEDFSSLQPGRGKMMILTKDLVSLGARDNNNNGSGLQNKW